MLDVPAPTDLRWSMQGQRESPLVLGGHALGQRVVGQRAVLGGRPRAHEHAILDHPQAAGHASRQVVEGTRAEVAGVRGLGAVALPDAEHATHHDHRLVGRVVNVHGAEAGLDDELRGEDLGPVELRMYHAIRVRAVLEPLGVVRLVHALRDQMPCSHKPSLSFD